MTEESFMLLSLKESKSKKLAQVISSDTCRKILDYLTEQEFVTETKAANDLHMPLSTVHYNFKALIKSGLVVADEFHYSGKGKEVPHYKLAKKFIIIAPKDENNIMDKLKKFWPMSAIVLGVGAIVEFGSRFFSGNIAKSTLELGVMANAAPRTMDVAVVNEVAPMITKVSVENTSIILNETANTASQRMAEFVPYVAQETTRTFPSLATQWFLAGALFVMLSLVVWEFIKKK